MKWFLISEADVKTVKAALESAIERQDERCADRSCMCDIRGKPHSKYLSDALHTFDSGLNSTDAVPDDWKEEKAA